MKISTADLQELQHAKRLLEEPSLAARLSNLFGVPVEKGFELLPDRWSDVVKRSTWTALERAVELSAATLDERGPRLPSNQIHKLIAAGAGAGGGFFGLAGLPIELPISTLIMLRSVADIARSQGERIAQIESRLACVEVFALGGRSLEDDAAETGYFAARTLLARSVSEAAKHIATKGLAEKGAPPIARLLSQIASRFGVAVSEKVAAQAIPLIGAAGGATINWLFMDHFQDVARGHFTVRKLERKYSGEGVERAWDSL